MKVVYVLVVITVQYIGFIPRTTKVEHSVEMYQDFNKCSQRREWLNHFLKEQDKFVAIYVECEKTNE